MHTVSRDLKSEIEHFKFQISNSPGHRGTETQSREELVEGMRDKMDLLFFVLSLCVSVPLWQA
jgi:hypothetical protein